MSISLDNSTLGTEQSNVKTILNTIDDGLIKSTVDIANKNLNQLVSTVDTMWVGVTADEFKNKVLKDKQTFISIMSTLANRMHQDITQMSGNVANADALVASHMGGGGSGGDSYSNNGSSFGSSNILSDDMQSGYTSGSGGRGQSEEDILNSLNDNKYADEHGRPIVTWDDFTLGLERTGATVGTFSVSLAEGVGEFGEALVDFGSIAGTALNTPSALLVDGGQAIYGKITGNEWESTTLSMWDDTMGFVSKEYVKSAFDSFYEDTAAGQTLKEYCYGYDTTRGVGSGVGYTAGVVALSAFTLGMGGAAVGATGASAGAMSTTMAGFGATAGFGKGSEKAWGSGASLGEGLAYGATTGTWEGLQYYFGGKINNFKPFASAGANVATRIGLDSLVGGAEGVVQPIMSMLYRDEGFKELFTEAGGLKNVGTQAVMAAAMSGVGEATGLAKKFRDTTDNSAVAANINPSNNMPNEVNNVIDEVSPKILNNNNSIVRDVSNYLDLNEANVGRGTKFNEYFGLPEYKKSNNYSGVGFDILEKGSLESYKQSLSDVQLSQFADYLDNTKSGQFLSKLSIDEINSLADYGGSGIINEQLRKDIPIIKESQKNMIGTLDSAIEKFGGLDDGMVLRRTVTPSKEFNSLGVDIDSSSTDSLFNSLKQLENKSYVDKGYMSTSGADIFGLNNDVNVVMELAAPEGTKCMPIDVCTGMPENEILLARDSKVSISQVLEPEIDSNGKTIIRILAIVEN